MVKNRSLIHFTGAEHCGQRRSLSIAGQLHRRTWWFPDHAVGVSGASYGATLAFLLAPGACAIDTVLRFAVVPDEYTPSDGPAAQVIT